MAHFLGQTGLPADPEITGAILLREFPGIGGWDRLRRMPSGVVSKMIALLNAEGMAERIRAERARRG